MSAAKDAIVILGASGQIGRCLLRRLGEAARPTIAICRHPPGDIASGAEWLAHDLTKPLDLGGRHPAAAIHVTGAWLLPAHLATLREAGVQRLICFSSTSMLAKKGSPSASERATAASLASAEAAVAVGGIPWTVLRPTLIYGLGLDRNVSTAAAFIRRWRFFPMGGPGRGLRQPVHADDLAAAALALLDDMESRGSTYNLGGGETLAYRAMIERIFHCLGLRPRFLRLPLLGAIPGGIGVMVQRMEQDLAFDRGELWPRLGLTPRRFLAGGRKDLTGGA